MAFEHIPEMVFARIRSSPKRAAFRVKRDGVFVDVTWAEVAPRIDAIAAGLLTAANLDDGACVTIVGSTGMDWIIADFAALSVGLKTVPVYASLLPEEVGFMHADTAAQLCIVENAAQLEKVRTARAGFEFFGERYAPERLPLRGKIVVVDSTGLAAADDWESLADVEARGRARLESLRGEMARRLASVRRDQLATFTYTSGTTGLPKAVLQTHGNMLAMLEDVDEVRHFDDAATEFGLFLFLPLAHSFGRLAELAGPYFGAPLVLSTVPTIAEDLVSSRPGFFPAAPRVFEKMRGKVLDALEASPLPRRKIARWALGVGEAASTFTNRGAPIPLLLRLRLALADKLALHKIRARLGLDRASLLLSGSAPLRGDVHRFFLSLGLTLVEAYGLTETCPGLTTNRKHDIRIGSVGKPFPRVSLRIADDGEILARGPNIAAGYLNQPDATREAIDGEGWFHTGDLGSIDADGFVHITGRKKELIKTSGGKYVVPVKVEALIKASPLVQEAMLVGDQRNYCVVLVALDPDALTHFASRHGIPNDPAHPNVRAALQSAVDEANARLAAFERVKTFRITPGPFTVAGGELTASLKVKRRAVIEIHAQLIEEMYST
jgi:long-chain acyl-CoA synthetase